MDTVTGNLFNSVIKNCAVPYEGIIFISDLKVKQIMFHSKPVSRWSFLYLELGATFLAHSRRIGQFEMSELMVYQWPAYTIDTLNKNAYKTYK